jgi:hypothetical protein
VVEARAKELKDEAKAELHRALETGDAVAGKWNGRNVSKATKVSGRRRMRITDPAAFGDWVASRWPTEVRVEQAVNTAFLSLLEDRALDKGALIDDDGEVCPFVEVVEGSAYVSVRKDRDATRIVADLLSSGQLSLDGPRDWQAEIDAGAIG